MSKAVLGMEGSGCNGRTLAILGTGPWLESPEPAWAPEAGGLYDPPILSESRTVAQHPPLSPTLLAREFLIT